MRARLKRTVNAAGRRLNRRVFGVVFVVVMIVVAVHALRQPRVYEASGEIGFGFAALVRGDTPLVEAKMICGPDINTVRAVVASRKILQDVIDRLGPAERRAFLEPYAALDDSDAEIERHVLANRRITTKPERFVVEVSYRHPDRHVAARIVGVHLSEVEAFEKRVRAESEAAAMKELEIRAEQARGHADDLERVLAVYRERQAISEGGQGESDGKYRALVEKRDKAVALETGIMERLAELRSPAKRTSPIELRILQYPTTPAEDDYLIMPVLVRLAGGAAVAAFLAGAIALLVGGRNRFNPRKETL